MDEKRLVKTSKFLSKHLRHAPEAIGLQLAPGGWVEVDALLRACATRGLGINRADLDAVVARNDKKRFAFDATGIRIRACQGHSTEVDLQLTPSEPPGKLYHGTAAHTVVTIRSEGLKQMRRHHVHLSGDVETARQVGARHGKPVILGVDTVAMRAAGFIFYRSENGVWLVAEVPPQYLRQQE